MLQQGLQSDRSASAGAGGISKSAVSWAFLEAGRTSYTVLIAVYVFVPYVAAVLVGDPVKGQGFVAQAGQWAGIAAALIAPILGTTVDHIGRRKPLLVALSLLTIPLCAALWFAGRMPIGATIEVLAVTTLVFALCEVVQNSLLVYAAEPHEQPAASGLAYAFGNGASVIVLGLVLWAFVLPGTVHGAWLPSRPLLGLSAARHQPELATGPLSAVIMLISVAPLILFTRDAPAASGGVVRAVKAGARDLAGLLGLLREAPAARLFLLARMIFADAQGGIVMFTGVFAAGVLGWGPSQLMIEGAVSSIFAAGGGLLASWLDPRIGAKRSLYITLGGCLVCALGEIGLGKDHILWLAYDPALDGRPWSLPLFNTWPDWVFIACDFGMSVFVVSAFASSRTLMAQLAPPGRTAAFFGLFALSGRATAWVCPFLVGAATLAFRSQQMGYVPIAVMMALGMAVMVFVADPFRRPEAAPAAGLEAVLEAPPRALIPDP